MMKKKVWSVWAVWGRCNTEAEARHILTETRKAHVNHDPETEFRAAIFPHLEDRKVVIQFRQVDGMCPHVALCASWDECYNNSRPCGHRLEDAYPCCLAGGTLRIIEENAE